MKRVVITMSEEEEHDCVPNLASNEEEIVVSGGEVHVYRKCSKCGDEFVTEYEYVETRPA